MALTYIDSQRNFLFEKSFSFASNKFPKINSVSALKGRILSSPLWEFVEGSQLKCDLDEARFYLNDKDLIEWGEHTSRTDLASFVMPKIRELLPSITNELFTRAWCKLMEVLMTFPVIDFDSQTIKDNGFSGLFLCEAPGSFVHATNHYIKSTRPETSFKWLASTLNIYYEEMDMLRTTIGDDRFIQCQSTYGNWFFGEDDRGDLLDINMIKQICSKYKDAGADLVTGDGGISCVDEPDRQEEKSFPLIFHQFLTAINCLKPGGSLILKTFNLFSSQSLSLVYLANSLFDQVHCFKPVLSKSGNSEIYLVCIKLLDDKQDLIDTFTSQYFNKLRGCKSILTTSALLDQSSIPSLFIQQFAECAYFFKDWQKITIVQNLMLFYHPERQKIYDTMIQSKKIVARVYTTRKYPLKAISEQLTSGHDYRFRKLNSFDYSSNNLSALILNNASYDVRKNHKGISPEMISRVLEILYQYDVVENAIRPWVTITNSDYLPTIKMKCGKRYSRITNSKFTDDHLLLIHNTFNMILEKVSGNLHKSAGYLTTPFNLGDSRFVCAVFMCLESHSTKFARMIGPQSSLLSRHLFGVLLKLPSINQTVEDHFSLTYDPTSSKDRSIFFIDPFDYSGALSRKKSDVGVFVPTVGEQDLLEEIINQLVENLPHVKPFDLLVIHSCSILSRLMVQLIYILTVLFKQISIVPGCIVRRIVPIQDEAKLLCNQACQLGMLIALTNAGQKPPEFVEQRERTVSVLKQIKSAFGEARDSGKMLLEIFPIIHVFNNSSFCDIIFAGNLAHLTERMKKLIDEKVIQCSGVIF